MENILSIDGTPNVIDGTELRPSKAPTEPQEKSGDAIDPYEQRLQDYKDRVSKWETKNAKACS